MTRRKRRSFTATQQTDAVGWLVQGDQVFFVPADLVASAFPSHRLWINEVERMVAHQSGYSNLWRTDEVLGNPYVSRDSTGPFALQLVDGELWDPNP